MEKLPRQTLLEKTKNFLIGEARSHEDPRLFHKISLVVFFAWVGLGADGLSSSCYGPEEAFLALQNHPFLGLFVAFATAVTIFVISSSYLQIIELFPAGGGGYLVASKLLTPFWGMVSGCALLVDYVLTITLSVASGADALFSFLPAEWYSYRLGFAIAVLGILTVLNIRGTKESVVPLVPIFLIFIFTHAFVIIYTCFVHLHDFGAVANATLTDIRSSTSELGLLGTILLVMRAYSMGAGTYTGIEAVSNGIPILREPRVQTAKRTMHWMAGSLAFVVVGLMLGYLFFKVQYQEGRTLNAVLLENLTSSWNKSTGYTFVLVTLISEAVLLFVAAQTGFLDGPRVLSNMALDRWVPTRFAILSDRFVAQNGILVMGTSALLLMVFSKGSVKLMVVLYSINVFITFFLSQLGMVRHWWLVRGQVKTWLKKAFINGFGLILTTFILVSVAAIKFYEGGWITIFITGSLVIAAILIKNSYTRSFKPFQQLEKFVKTAEDVAKFTRVRTLKMPAQLKPEPSAKTAVVLVSGYNGMGLHTFFSIFRLFGNAFKNFVFLQVGIIDAGNFKGVEEIEKLKNHVNEDLNKYITLVESHGFYAEGFSAIGTDTVDEIFDTAKNILQKYPHTVFFGGQMIFPNDTFFGRLLHNFTTFAVQRKFYQNGIPFIIIPVKV